MHQPDNGGHGNAPPLGAELGAVAMDDLGLLLQHQDDRATGGHDAERLEAGVEQ